MTTMATSRIIFGLVAESEFFNQDLTPFQEPRRPLSVRRSEETNVPFCVE
jgi:hypothetical protein